MFRTLPRLALYRSLSKVLGLEERLEWDLDCGDGNKERSLKRSDPELGVFSISGQVPMLCSEEPMAFFFLCDAGKGRGLGHLTRCLSIQQALAELGLSSTLVVDGEVAVEGHLKANPYQLVDWKKDWMAVRAFFTASDQVLIDSYEAPKEIYIDLRRIGARIVSFQDLESADFRSHVVINGALSAERETSVASQSQQRHFGIAFAPLRRAFWDCRAAPIRPEIQRVLIAFGNEDVDRLSKRISALIGQSYPQWESRILMGSGSSRIDRRNVECFQDLDDEGVLALMRSCDIALTACGQTLHELARVGLPSIGFLTAENQQPNAIAWRTAGWLGRMVDPRSKSLDHDVLLEVENLRKIARRRCLAKRGRNLIDGQGSRRLASLLAHAEVPA